MSTSYCSIHDADEEVTDEAKVCFECGHAYPNRKAIEDEHRTSLTELQGSGELSVARIEKSIQQATDTFCPLCLHDWW